MIVSASDVINATLDGNVQFNITAEDEDTVNFEVINQPESATKKQSGNVLYFSWNVTSSQKVHNFKQKSAQPVKTSVSPRSSPLGTFRAETAPATKREEKRMFSQATISATQCNLRHKHSLGCHATVHGGGSLRDDPKNSRD